MSSNVNTDNSNIDDDVIIRVRNVTKVFEMYDSPRHRLQQLLFGRFKKFYREFKALDDISFEVRRGECVGLIGRNGSGKSTTLQIITGTLQPTCGEIYIKPGLRIAALLELGSGFNPEFTGRENVFLNASILGFTQEETERLFPEIEKFAEIGDFINQPVKTYSSGMLVRLAFAVQIMANPDILIIDEALAVGDGRFQAKCLDAMGNVFKNKNCTVLFVSHSQQQVQALCNRSILLQQGKIMYDGEVETAFQTYNSEGSLELSPLEVDLSKATRMQPGIPIVAKIMSFKLLDKKSSSFKPEEKMRFSIKLLGLQGGDDFMLRVVFDSSTGIPATMACSPTPLSIKKDELKEFIFEIDTSTLAPTWYTVKLALFNYAVRDRLVNYDAVARCYCFALEDSETFFGGRHWETDWWGYLKVPQMLDLTNEK